MTVTFIQHRIIDAIREMVSHAHSDNGFVTSIDAICKELPGYKRNDIVGGISEMKGIQLLDSERGAIKFPSEYFIEK